MRSPLLRLTGPSAPLRRPGALPLLLLLLVLSACQEEPLQPGTEPPDPDSIPRDQALGVVWEEVPGNPRMPLPDCPTWNCLGNTDPWVGRGPGGQRMAWYSSGGSLGGPVVGRALVTEDLRFLPDPAEAPGWPSMTGSGTSSGKRSPSAGMRRGRAGPSGIWATRPASSTTPAWGR